MKVIHNMNKIGLDLSKKIYECSVCGKLFNWDINSSWYGSEKDAEEHPEKIKYFCSDQCAKNNN